MDPFRIDTQPLFLQEHLNLAEWSTWGPRLKKKHYDRIGGQAQKESIIGGIYIADTSACNSSFPCIEATLMP